METNSNQRQASCEMQCRHEHLVCANYDRGKRPLVEFFNLLKGEGFDRDTDESVILYVMEGSLHVSTHEEGGRFVPAGGMLLLPLGIHVYARGERDCFFMAWRIKKNIRLCHSLSLEKLYSAKLSALYKTGSVVLEANPCIKEFFDSFVRLMEKGLRCTFFIESKLEELVLLMRVFHTKEALAAFFSPLLSKDASFKRLVMEHYSDAESIEELASKACFSRSGFHLHFKKVIGESPSRWINREKAKRIRVELSHSDKPLKQIYEEAGFSSASYFTRFCKKHLGDTPGNIRKEALGV